MKTKTLGDFQICVSVPLSMFVIILTADDKCVLLNRENLRKPIQRQLYEKQKTFSEFFSTI